MARERKRTQDVEQPVRVIPRWKVINGGITLLRDRNTTYYRGDEFEAYEEEVPMAFRDLVILLTPAEQVAPAPKKPVFTLQEIVPTAEEMDKEDYETLYNILDAQDKVVSEKPLPLKEAEEFINALSK